MSTVVDAEGNYFVVGGGVRGGQVLGEYPSRVHVEHNPLGISNGRVIPTIPWEVIVVWLFSAVRNAHSSLLFARAHRAFGTASHNGWALRTA